MDDLINDPIFQVVVDDDEELEIGDPDINRVLMQAEYFRMAFKFDWLQQVTFFGDEYNAIIVEYANQILTFCVLYGNQKRLFYQDPDYADHPDGIRREYVAEVVAGADYLIIANPGDRWHVQCVHNEGLPSEYCGITVISAIPPFNFMIPIVRELHVMVKSGDYLTAILLPSDTYAYHLENDDFQITEANAPSDENALVFEAGKTMESIFVQENVPQHYKILDQEPEGNIHFCTEIILKRQVQNIAA